MSGCVGDGFFVIGRGGAGGWGRAGIEEQGDRRGDGLN